MRWILLAGVWLMSLAGGWWAAARTDQPGPRLAYISRGDLYVTGGPTHKPLRLTYGAGALSPRWSADGRWLTYHTGDELWLASADGRRLERLGARSPGAGQAEWAPGRPLLAYISGRSLWVLAFGPDGPGKPREIHTPADSFAWSPDGASLAAEEPYQGPWPGGRAPQDRQFPEAGVVILPAEGGAFREVFRIPRDPQRQGAPLYPIKNLVFSPDGRWLTFHRLHWSSSLSADETTLMAVPVAGGIPRDVGKMLAYPDWVDWKPGAAALTYLAGVGRDTWDGSKQLRMAYPPDFLQVGQTALTPADYGDHGFAWAPACGRRPGAGPATVLAVSRSGPDSPRDQYGRPVPAMYRDGKQISRPEPPFRDEAPHFDCLGRLYWVRLSYDQAMVMAGGKPWVAVDIPDGYYGHWPVAQVLDWWEPGRLPAR